MADRQGTCGCFLSGGFACPRFVEAVLAAIAKSTTMLDSLADYPRWLVVLCTTIVLAVVLWVGMKLLKVALWLLIGTVLVVGLGATVWLLIK